MYFLNNLKDFTLYKKRKIVGMEQDVKDIKKDTCIILASDNEMDIQNLVTARILFPTSFKAYYVPYKFVTAKLKKVKGLDQKEIYTNIRQTTYFTNFKKTISQYKNMNLIYDICHEKDLCMQEIKFKGQAYILAYLNFLLSRKDIPNHKNKIIAVPVGDQIDLTSIKYTNMNSSFGYIYLAIKKRILPTAFNGVTFLFYANNGTFFKFTYNVENQMALFNKCFTKIVAAANSTIDQVQEDEVPDETNEDKINKIVSEDEKIVNVRNRILNKLNVDPAVSRGALLTNKINSLDDKLENKLSNMNINYNSMSEDEVINIIKDEPEIVNDIEDISNIATKGITDEVEIERLRKKQNEIDFDGKALEDIFNEALNLTIDRSEIDNDNILNKEVTKNATRDFDNTYEKKQMKKDIVNILTAFNEDQDMPLFIKSITSENTSDAFTKKMTYTVKFQDANKVIHTFKINYPIIKDGTFMIVNGGKKLLQKQFMLLPIVKTGPNTVQISTNYNKLFIERFGQKLNDGTVNIKKLLSEDLSLYKTKDSKLIYRIGNALTTNGRYTTSLEYGEISKNIVYIEDSNYTILFEQQKLDKMLNDELDLSYDKQLGIIQYDKLKYFPIGYTKDKKYLIISDLETSEVYKKSIEEDGYIKVKENLVYFLVDEIFKNNLTKEKIDEFYGYPQSKTFVYNRMRITGRTVPIIMALAYEVGLQNILERYKIKYEFTNAVRVVNKFGQKKVRFLDGYLLYNSMDLKSTLLLDGLASIDTSEYAFEDMNTKLPYIEYFFEQFGSRNVGKGIHNILSLMVDPITKEILESLKLPTNIIDLLLYANTLLSTASYKKMNDMSSYRMRGAEQINAVLYRVLANAFKTYKDTSNNGTPIKISVDPDILMKQLMAEKTVDEYSILNPSLEIDKMTSATFKGPSGINLDLRHNRNF